mmetsp:Transcript_44071/g.109139  ORF Transcript_44071/g.109139 Transcript_44071/m.109139 type:complete len:218 (+) Transcript_44071:722-1375(+)
MRSGSRTRAKRVDRVWRAERAEGHGHGVDAHEERGASARLVLRVGVLRVERDVGEAEVGVEREQLADRTLAHQPRRLHSRGPSVRPVALHQKAARLARGGYDHARLGPVHAHRLLAEHVLARREAEEDLLGVAELHRGDVDDVHILRARELCVRTIATRDRRAAAIGAREVRGTSGAAAGDRCQLVARARDDGGAEVAGDASGAEDAPADRPAGRER